MTRKKLTLNLSSLEKVTQKIEAYKNPKPTDPKKLNVEIVDWLIADFPKSFNVERTLIFKRKAANDKGKQYTKKEIKRALGFYASHPNYLNAILEKSHRVNLDGTQGEEIFDVHREFAKKKIEDQLKNRKKKPAPKNAARRPMRPAPPKE